MKSFGLTLVGVGGVIYIFCNIVANFIDWPIVGADSSASVWAGFITELTLISLGVVVIGFFVFIYEIIHDKLFKKP